MTKLNSKLDLVTESELEPTTSKKIEMKNEEEIQQPTNISQSNEETQQLNNEGQPQQQLQQPQQLQQLTEEPQINEEIEHTKKTQQKEENQNEPEQGELLSTDNDEKQVNSNTYLMEVDKTTNNWNKNFQYISWIFFFSGKSPNTLRDPYIFHS